VLCSKYFSYEIWGEGVNVAPARWQVTPCLCVIQYGEVVLFTNEMFGDNRRSLHSLSCHPSNRVKALKGNHHTLYTSSADINN